MLYSPCWVVNIKQNKIAVVNWVFCQVSELKPFLKRQEYPSVDDFKGKKGRHGLNRVIYCEVLYCS